MKDRNQSQLSADDQRWVDAIGEQYQPPPMGPLEQAAFRRRISERIAHRRRTRWAVGLAAPLAAAAAALFLIVRAPTVPTTKVAELDDAEPFLYAYVAPQYGADETMGGYLPAEYQALAEVLDMEAPETNW